MKGHVVLMLLSGDRGWRAVGRGGLTLIISISPQVIRLMSRAFINLMIVNQRFILHNRLVGCIPTSPSFGSLLVHTFTTPTC